MIISVFKENNHIFLSCHSFQVETTMAASLNFLTANINSHEISVLYRIGSKIKLQKFVFYLKPVNE